MKKSFKTLLSLVLALAFVFALTACGNDSSTSIVSGLKYKYDATSGSYAVIGYTIASDADPVAVTIPATYKDKAVTEIKENAFRNNSQITSVVVPESVTKIGAGAFQGMTALESLTIPFVGGSADAVNATKLFGYIFGTAYISGTTSVTMNYNDSSTATYYIPTSLKTVTITGDSDIPAFAFYGISTVSYVILEGNVKSIGRKAFCSATGLIEIALPDGLESIGESAFYVCSKLQKLTFGTAENGLTIGDTAFYGCTRLGGGSVLNYVLNLPEGLSSLGKDAFYGCTKLATVAIPTTLATLKNRTFYGCTELSSVTLKSGLTSIGVECFASCTALKAIAIPSTLTTINAGAFFGCSQLKDVVGITSAMNVDSTAFFDTLYEG